MFVQPPHPLALLAHLQVHVQAGAPWGHPAGHAKQRSDAGRILSMAAVRIQKRRKVALESEARFDTLVHCVQRGRGIACGR